MYLNYETTFYLPLIAESTEHNKKLILINNAIHCELYSERVAFIMIEGSITGNGTHFPAIPPQSNVVKCEHINTV